MLKSDSIVNLSKALLKAQKEMEGAIKDSKNPFFKSNYADYTSVLAACKGPLNNAGVVILQPTSIVGDQMVIETVLIHSETGEFISSATPVVVAKQNDPQAQGSAISYSKRYGLQSLISLPSFDDDDGEAAMGRPATKPVVAAKVEAPKVVAPKAETPVETPKTVEAPKRGGFKPPAPKPPVVVEEPTEDEWS